jgi:hypothetical protein
MLLTHDVELPHAHPDHRLSLALKRMGSSGLNVLLVSRANVMCVNCWGW